jgi:hypothetical protein
VVPGASPLFLAGRTPVGGREYGGRMTMWSGGGRSGR